MSGLTVRVLDSRIEGAATDDFFRWLIEEEFIDPGVDWAALSVEVFTDGQRGMFGRGGFFYERNGKSHPARFVERDVKDERPGRAYQGWMGATYKALGAPWLAVLIQLVKDGRVVVATTTFDFTDPNRWTDNRADVFRPAALPTPLLR